ncbi:MAG: hypothetical protein KJ893_01055 [Candidatus Omnitrophica bacterium]|nr:hypothetical protein [Candidatus Omnitrophota bacterium]MBU4478791.1 hypothetical protein [Candidatus Omnitrophota bacterium]MCG2703680.1 hypothetical protein [Candidatus Omnitrophota bacterium]
MVGSGKIVFLFGVVVMLGGLAGVKALIAEDDGKNRVIFEQKVIHQGPLKPVESAQGISGKDEKAEGSQVEDTSGGEKQDSNDVEIMKRLIELLQKMLGEGNSEGLSKELIDQLSGQEKKNPGIDTGGFKEWEERHEWEGLRQEMW